MINVSNIINSIKVFIWGENTSLEPHQEAAIFLEFAKQGQMFTEKSITRQMSQAYTYRVKYQPLFRLAAWSSLIVHIFERPIWTFRRSNDDWKHGDIYPSYELTYLPLIVSTLLYGLCITCLWFAVFNEFGYKSFTVHSSYLTYIFCFILIVQSCSVIMYLIFSTIGGGPVFSTVPIGTFVVLLVEYKYENYIGYIFRTIPKFSFLLIFMSIIVCIYTTLGFEIFDPDSDEGKQYFPNFGTALWNMLMVLNGSNWPSPMMPAFNSNRLYCLYFFAFVIIMDWGFLNLLLGLIYLFVRVEQKAISQQYEKIRIDNIQNAFSSLDKEKSGKLSYDIMYSLLDEIYNKFMPGMIVLEMEEKYDLILQLDSKNNNYIDLDDFLFIFEKCFPTSLSLLRRNKVRVNRFFNLNQPKIESNILQNNLERPLNSSESIPDPSIAFSEDSTSENIESDINSNFNHSSVSQSRTLSEIQHYGKVKDTRLLSRLLSTEMKKQDDLKQKPFSHTIYYWMSFFGMMVDHIYFDITLDSLIFFFGVLSLSGFDSNSCVVLYLTFSLLECACKIIVKGLFRYWKSVRNSIDGIITLIIFTVVINLSIYNQSDYGSDFGISSLILLRTFLFPRNILATDSFQKFRNANRLAFKYAFDTAGHFLFLLLTTFTFLYAFSAMGLQLFGGTIMKTGKIGEEISKSEYGQSGYWPLNFNDMPSGLVTMFILLHVNNMHVTASGFEASINQSTEMFFALWYILGVLLFLNILTAVFVNSFASYLQALAVKRREESNEKSQKDEERESQSPFKESIFASESNRKALWDQIIGYVNTFHTFSSFSSATESKPFSSESKETGTFGSTEESKNPLSEPLALPENRNQSNESDQRLPSNQRSLSTHEVTLLKKIHEQNIQVNQVSNPKFEKWVYSETRNISVLEKAAILIQFSRNGVESNFANTSISVWCFRMRSKFSTLFKAVAAVFATLRIFERPLWTFRTTDWKDVSLYPNSGIPLLSVQCMTVIKFPLLIIIFIGLYLELGYKETFKLADLRKLSFGRIYRFLLTLYCFVSILILLASIGMNFSKPELVTITSGGSILYLLWFNKRSLMKFKTVLSILPKITLVLVSLLFLVLIFASFGPVIYNLEDINSSGDDDRNQYFDNFSDSIWSVFVAITSSSFPNQIMPSYQHYREVAFYFISFITIGSFGLLNLLIVIVLIEFQKANQKAVDLQQATSQILLIRAFEVLDDEKIGYLNRKQIFSLLDYFSSHFADRTKFQIPQMPAAKNLFYDILDLDGDSNISLSDFLYFMEVLRIKIQPIKRKNETKFTRYLAWVKNLPWYSFLEIQVQNKRFELAMDSLGAILIFFRLALNARHLYHPTNSTIGITIAIVFIYIFEIVVKVSVLGWNMYIRSFRNKFDLTITLALFSCLFINLCAFSLYTPNGWTISLRVLFIVRFLFYLRNLRIFFPKNIMILKLSKILMRVLARILTISIVFLCIGYVFASIGVFLYGGLFSKETTNETILNSNYVLNDFWTLNFNDFTSAIITLFCCLKVSDFDVIASGFIAGTTEASRFYFAAWYTIGVLIMLNVLKSFFLSEFLSIFTDNSNNLFSSTLQDEEIESALKDETPFGESDISEHSKSSFADNKLSNLPFRSKLIEKVRRDSVIQSIDNLSPTFRPESLVSETTLEMTASSSLPPGESFVKFSEQNVFHENPMITQQDTDSQRSSTFDLGNTRDTFFLEFDNQDIEDEDGNVISENFSQVFARESSKPRVDSTLGTEYQYYISTAAVKHLDSIGQKKLKARLKQISRKNN